MCEFSDLARPVCTFSWTLPSIRAAASTEHTFPLIITCVTQTPCNTHFMAFFLLTATLKYYTDKDLAAVMSLGGSGLCVRLRGSVSVLCLVYERM